jgi:methionine-rich copper-binding protein CopC
VSGTYTYNGKFQTPKYKVTIEKNGKTVTLKEGTDYKVVSAAHKVAGSHVISIQGINNYEDKLTVKNAYTIKKKAQSIKVSTKYKAVAAKTFKKKSKSYKISTTGVKEKGKVTYKTNSKKITVKNGKITLKKGIKKGTYKVTVTVAATDNYKKTTKTLTIKVK